LQPWNVYAVIGEPLKKIKRQAVEAIETEDWRTFETEYPEFPGGSTLAGYSIPSAAVGRETSAGRDHFTKLR
jgi:hypothetical protein